MSPLRYISMLHALREYCFHCEYRAAGGVVGDGEWCRKLSLDAGGVPLFHFESDGLNAACRRGHYEITLTWKTVKMHKIMSSKIISVHHLRLDCDRNWKCTEKHWLSADYIIMYKYIVLIIMLKCQFVSHNFTMLILEWTAIYRISI